MRVSSVSGDLLVKLAIGAGLAGLAWYAFSKGKAAISSAVDAVTSAPSAIYDAVKQAGAGAAEAVATVAPQIVAAVNPASDKNLLNRAVNATGSAVSGDSGWTLGGWVYDVLHAGDSYTVPKTAAEARARLDAQQSNALDVPIWWGP